MAGYSLQRRVNRKHGAASLQSHRRGFATDVMNSVDPSASRHAGPSPAQSQPAVSVEGATVKYRDHTVLHDLSLQIQQGELLTLLGPSGCGKTTLLNLIAGFVEANSGEIFIDQQKVTSLPPHKRQIGIVFQNYALFPHMDVERNIGYGLRMRGVPASEIAERVKAAMALVELDGLEHRRSRELSGGQQQRVALARALVIEPKVLLVGDRHGGGRLDIYVRPEHVHLEPLNADSILTGTVVHHVFQGDHCDTYVNVDLSVSGSQRVMVRSPGLEVMARWPVGTVAALALAPHDMSVFPAAAA